jgi:anaerobic magnesium-protoporphyrin IX monomethyl ester cyclase
MSTREIVDQVVDLVPEAIFIGHSGSTSGHPIVADITRAIHAALPDIWIIYGGVFPTYHWREILIEEPPDQHHRR